MGAKSSQIWLLGPVTECAFYSFARVWSWKLHQGLVLKEEGKTLVRPVPSLWRAQPQSGTRQSEEAKQEVEDCFVKGGQLLEAA